MSPLVMIALTALASSLTTVVLVGVILHWRGDRWLAATQRSAGEELERRVREGAVAAGEELLPRFRAEVTQGFVDALKKAPSSEVAGDALNTLAQSGADAVMSGLDSLLKPRPARGDGR
ncbi:MAG: hypothetical protein ABF296_01355 [Oceanococcaceae bacterium]